MIHKRRFVVLIVAAGLLLAGLGSMILLRPARRYEVTFLPSLGGARTIPHAINDRRQVVGVADTNGAGTHVFLWDRQKGMQDLGPAGQHGYFLNNAGQIAGTMADPNGEHHAFLWDPNEGRTVVKIPGGGESFAFGLNNQGEMVGLTNTARHPMRAFRWDKASGLEDIAAFGESWSRARSINDAGQIFALAAKGTADSWPYFWDRRATTLGKALPGGDFHDMNNDGCIVGQFFSFDTKGHAMVLWRSGTGLEELFPIDQQDLGTVKLNDAYQVLYSQKHRSQLERVSQRRFPPRENWYLWDADRGRVLLNEQVPSGADDFMAGDLNNAGDVVGFVVSKDGSGCQAVLLEPISER